MSSKLLRIFFFFFIFHLALLLFVYLYNHCDNHNTIILSGIIAVILFITLLYSGVSLYLISSEITHDASMAKSLQERHHQLFTNIDRAIIVFKKINESYIIVDLNNAVEKIENKSKDEILNKPLLEVFPKAKDFGIIDILDEVYFSGTSKDMPIKYYHADHSKGYRENHIFKLTSGEIVSIYKDVTKDVEFKKELLHAKKTAEKEQELRAKFMSNMSHELRTPLNGIMMASELFSMTDLDYEQEELNQIISKSSENLLDIINSIIDMSSIDLNRLILHEYQARPADLLNNSYSVYSNMAKQKNLSVNIQTDEYSENYYLTDPHRVRQIYMNLIHNAVKFTDRGTINIFLKKYEGTYSLPDSLSLENYDIMEFIIEDTGVGIPEDALNILYEKFLQVDMSTTKKYGGSGIGLSITQALLNMMHGSIRVESTLGIGSKFMVYIPVKKIIQKENEQREISESTEGDTEINKDALVASESKRILVVEDNIINQTLTAKMLESLGFEADVASNGKEAIEKIKNNDNQYDLILMDIQMPVLNGYEASKKIRYLENAAQKPRIPIVALTAYVSDYDKEKCFQCGMDDFLSKPVDKKELSRSLRYHIQGNIN